MKTAGFTLPHLQESHTLQRVLSSALQSTPSHASVNFTPFWPARHFNLQQSQLFQNATADQQETILALTTQGLLEEAYFIEKAGVGYMAKMVMLSASTEERMLYALFSADETYHLAQIMRFLPEKPVETDDAFLRFLADIVESEDKSLILFVLQVVLEGWGLSHYRSLAQDCTHPELAGVLTSFLQDESRHHATGVTLLKQHPPSDWSMGVIIETLATFLQMIQVGPQRVVSAVEQGVGHLGYGQKVQLFEELDTETQSGVRLAKLRSLIAKETSGKVVTALEERGLFTPFPASLCAELML
ncbi:ferritin-like domain-containing protein [Spirulina sp. CS-785/01]|uniref:ferritin-like domain-containing protein n=1 Tax=Spirulina sp. CS-785/01 TaxID=3021716 RepID=UPI00232ED726|nr:ferritin-like domain-containing protein [Spirulina sp. CS-785/01]MDB9313967.1 ferritin-like domain-containing protein [Spirulina sp. CS-785/01]